MSTYVVIRVGRYSNKAKSNSIHWTAETVRLFQREADLLLRERQRRRRRQTLSPERNNNNSPLELKRSTLISFLPIKKIPALYSRCFGAVPCAPSSSTSSPSYFSSSSSFSFSSSSSVSSSSARPHQLDITKSLCARASLPADHARGDTGSRPAFKVKVIRRRRGCRNSWVSVRVKL